MALKKLCPKCNKLIDQGQKYCDECTVLYESSRSERYKEVDGHRGSSRERGYNHRWEKARTSYLRKNPLCVMCLEKGILTPATVVDHIIPHRGDKELFWDASNWQSLCKKHHDKKTAKGE